MEQGAPRRAWASINLPGYEVLLELKRGGMGEVLLARRLGAHGFERLVAVKTLRGDLRGREDVRAMFRDEARLLAQLHHPAITQAFDLCEVDGALCLVFEYVRGVELCRLAELRAPPAVCAQAIADVLRGLHAAHELLDDAGRPLGVVHRDVSPDNLMITFEGQVKILDFGIAWMQKRDTPETELGMVKGKPRYMSPEQLRMRAVDRRTDVFATSLVLHELLTGKPVFAGESPMEVALAIAERPIPPPSEEAGPLPGDLDAIVLRGLEREPDARFPTAAAMADALERVAAAAGGETLDAFVRRALADDRRDHESRLAAALRGAPTPAPTEAGGRPTGMATVVDRSEPGGPPPAPAPRAQEAVERTAAVGAHAGGRRALVAALAAAAAIATIALLRLVPTSVGAGDGAPAAAPSASEHAAATSAAATAEAPRAPAAGMASSAGAATPAEPPARSAAARGGPLHPQTATLPASPAPTAAPSSPTAQADQGFGFLTVAAEPFALVQLDGASIGPTPIFNRKVAAGPHVVVLLSPDSGTVRLSRTVVVAPGATQQVVAR